MSNLEFTRNPKLLTVVGSDDDNIRSSGISHLQITIGGNTVLHIAAIQGKLNLAKASLMQMPELLQLKNAQGDTPLHLAARTGQVNMVELLVSVASSSSLLLYELARAVNNVGNTALHEAVLHDCFPVVNVLLRATPSWASVANRNGESALYMAAVRCSTGIARGLLRIERASWEGPNGETALHAAVSSASYDMVDSLVTARPTLLRLADKEGNTPLHLAALYGYCRMVQLLLEDDLSAVHARDVDGFSPIHVATKYGHLSVVQCLIDKCPDCVELVDNDGCNLFHLAIIYEVVRIVNHVLASVTLIKLVNVPDKRGNTPMHLAVLSGNMELVKKLSSRTEFVTCAINHAGDTAFDVVYTVLKKSELANNMMWLVASTSFGFIDPLRFSPPRLSQILDSLATSPHDFQATDVKSFLKKLSVVAMFIATATYAAAFTLPGGYQSDQGQDPGTAWLTKRAVFDAFLILDTLAMIISLFVTFKVSGPWRPKENHGVYAMCSLRYAIVVLMAAFACGVYVVISDKRLSLATLICLIVLAPLVLGTVRQLPSQLKDIMRICCMSNRISHVYVYNMIFLPFGSSFFYFKHNSPLRVIYDRMIVFRLGPIRFGRYDMAWDIIRPGPWGFSIIERMPRV